MKIGKLFNRPKEKSEVLILIVDDERDFLDMMAFWFKSQGYGVASVTSGSEALDFLKEKKPDMIFMDIRMPGMDGIETLKKIKESGLTIPVVMLTAYGSQEQRSQAHELGVNAIFDKTLDFYKAEHLINSFVRVVAKKRK